MNHLLCCIVASCILVFLGSGCRPDEGQDHSLSSDSTDQVSRLSEAPECADEDINRFADGETALYGAAFKLDANAVRRLLASGADVDKGTEDGLTPLHAATDRDSQKALEVVSILLSHGANVNARDARGCTPLFDTLFAGNLDVTELLVEYGADLDIRAREDGATVLHDAASLGDLEAVTLFVSHGADINARDFDGETPLHKAALIRAQEIVDYLVSQGADLHARSQRGETPQNFLDEPDNVEPILVSGGDTYPLTLIRTDRLHVRLMLRSAGVDYDGLWSPSETDIDGLDRSLREWLEEEASDVEDGDVDRDYLLSHFDEYHREYAGFVKNATRYIFGSMIQAPKDPPMRASPGNAFLSTTGGGCVQARVIFAARSKAVVAFRCGWRVTKREGKLRTDSAGRVQGPPMAGQPADGRQRPESPENVADVNRFDEYGWGTLLYQAVFGADIDVVRHLLSIGADVNKGNENGRTPLHVAAGSESELALEIVEILISHGASVNAKIESKELSEGTVNLGEGDTPLHEAVGVMLTGEDFEVYSNIAMVELLLAHGADVNAQDARGCTPLFYAVFLDVMELLVEHGTDLNVKNNEDGGTVLHDAASDGDLEAVKLFVSHGADIDARDFEGETPLHKAALISSQETVDYLVSHGADLHARSKRGETPQDFLDEPRDAEPILLSHDDQYPFRLIVTDGLNIRMTLKSEPIDYDAVWFPVESDIVGLDVSLKKWLQDKASVIEHAYFVPEYILAHFDQYNREYAGFVKGGTRYIFCNMVESAGDSSLSSPAANRFTGLFDGGCAQVLVVFEADSHEVVALRCNGM